HLHLAVHAAALSQSFWSTPTLGAYALGGLGWLISGSNRKQEPGKRALWACRCPLGSRYPLRFPVGSAQKPSPAFTRHADCPRTSTRRSAFDYRARAVSLDLRSTGEDVRTRRDHPGSQR